MRIVIEGITGKDLVLLMYILEKMDFENKEELLIKFHKWVNEGENPQSYKNG